MILHFTNNFFAILIYFITFVVPTHADAISVALVEGGLYILERRTGALVLTM